VGGGEEEEVWGFVDLSIGSSRMIWAREFFACAPNNYSYMSNIVPIEPSVAHQQPPRIISEDRT